MTILIGKIKSINDESSGKYVKNKVALKIKDKQIAFVEFRGLMKRIIENYSIDDQVRLVVSFDGKTSKASGLTYNNIVAETIEKLTN